MRLGAGDRKDLEPSGIKSSGDALDVAALACSVPSLVGNDDRDFPAVQFVVQGVELFLQTVQFFPVFLIRYYLVGKCDLGQERSAVERESVLADRSCKGVILECGIDTLIQEAQYLQLSPFAVLCVNYVPGGRRAVRILQIFVVHVQILIVMFVLMKIGLTHAPAGVFVCLQGSQTLFLLFFAELEEKLHDQIAVVSQRALCGVDTLPAFSD